MFKPVCLLLLISSGLVFAKPEVNVSGFGTIGIVTTDSDDFGYRADFSKPGGVFDGDIDFAESSNLGIQFDILATDDIDFVVQAIYRDQAELTLDTAINLAFVRYSPNANWSFRAGRTAYDLFLLTEYRDIGYAYSWAHVPSEIYGIFPHRFLDGVDVTYSKPVGDLTFSAKLFFGKNEYGMTAFSSPNAGGFKLDNISGIALDLQAMNWDFAVNHTQLTFDSQAVEEFVTGIKQLDALVPNFQFIWPNASEFADGLNLDNQQGSYTSVSGQYRFDTMTVISELAQVKSDNLSVQKVNSGYVSSIFHQGAHNFFTSVAFSDSQLYDLAGTGVNVPVLAQIPNGLDAYLVSELLLNYYSINQQTYSVGWRWDFAENMSFKMQWDHTRINKGGSTIWQPPQENDYTINRTGRVNAFFANLSFLY